LPGCGGTAVCDSVKRAVGRARSRKCPVLLGAVTYRYRGHSMSDPAKYRKDGELDEVKAQKDCLELAVGRLKDMGVTDAELEAIHTSVNDEAQDAYDFVHAAELPDPAKLYDYTYAEGA